MVQQILSLLRTRSSHHLEFPGLFVGSPYCEVNMMKRFHPRPVPRGPVQEDDFVSVVVLDGHPYAVFRRVDHDLRNNRTHMIYLMPFAVDTSEEKKSAV